MTAMRAFLLGVLLALLIVPGVPAQAQDRDFDVDLFYEELAPYGDWFEHPRWGLVWQPRVERDWRPYSQGYWAYTDEYAWYWMSDEPWAWAVFHYGRWAYDEDDGWIWIPDTEWGPAWVTWRWSDENVGWAALGPGSSWDSGGELRYDLAYYESPAYVFAWCFVHPRYLTTPGLYRYLAPRPQNAVILRRTRHVHSYRRFDRRVVNAGIDVRRYEQLTGRPVARARLKTVDSPRELGARRDRGGPEVHVFMPRIISRPDGPKRLPQLKGRPERKGPGPSVTGFPQGPSGGPPKKDGGTGPSPRIFQPPSGDQKQPFKQTTTPPPTNGTPPPSVIQKQPFKQTITPSTGGTPQVERKFTPPRDPSAPAARDRQGGHPPGSAATGQGPSTVRTQKPVDKDKKDDKKSDTTKQQ